MNKEIKLLAVIAILVIVAAFIGFNYYRNSTQRENAANSSNSNKTVANAEALVRPDSPTLGPADAPVTIVEFLDPECESCGAFHPIVKNILKVHEGKIRLVIRYMPLHPNSVAAAVFTEAAGDQGKYWEAQDLLFKRQSEWGLKHGQPAAPQSETRGLFEKYAKELGLDLDKMDSAIAENKFAAKIERDKQDGQSLGVRQTPTIFVNGKRLARLDETSLNSLVQEELKK